MGLIIARWTNSEDDGIYWMGDEAEGSFYNLFAVMERYLTRGETTEILKYDAHDRMKVREMLERERKAHGWPVTSTD